MYVGAVPYFLLAGQELLNNVFMGQLKGRGGPKMLLICFPDLNP
jgi:hypothetical protein